MPGERGEKHVTDDGSNYVCSKFDVQSFEAKDEHIRVCSMFEKMMFKTVL